MFATKLEQSCQNTQVEDRRSSQWRWRKNTQVYEQYDNNKNVMSPEGGPH